MAISVDFIFRASSKAFTAAAARTQESIKGLKAGVAALNITGAGSLLGVGGIVAGFRAAITAAQEMRTEAQRLGTPLSENARSVAEFGDGLAVAVKGLKAAAVATLGFFTRTSEAAGSLANRLLGISAESEKINEASNRETEAVLQRIAAAKEANSQEKVAEARRRFEEAESKSSSGKRLAFILTKQNDLQKELGKTGENTVRFFEIQNELLDVQAEKKKIIAEQDKAFDADEKSRATERLTQAKAEEDAAQKAAALRREVAQEFAPNVEELAAMSTGGFGVANDDPRLVSRRILDKEARARSAFGSGDIKRGLLLAGEAKEARRALEENGATGRGGQLTQETAQAAFETALTKTNDELSELKTAVQGIIKAQK